MQQSGVYKQIAAFLAVAFGLSAIMWVFIAWDVRAGGGREFLYVPLMWAPALAAFAVGFAFRRSLRGMGWKLGKPVYYLIAFALPVGYISAIYAATWGLGLGGLDTSGLGESFLMGLLQTMTIGLVMAFVFATGEEIGWRGVLVPQLAKVQPFVKVAIISGVIWGLWHLPVILFGGYNSGTPFWYAIACFGVSITAGSFAYAWLRLSSGSLWPAALMHAVHNVVFQGVMDMITVDTGSTAYFSTEFGVFLSIAGVILALIFWRVGVRSSESSRAANPEAVASVR